MATVTLSASILPQDSTQLGDGLSLGVTFNKWKWVIQARPPVHKMFSQTTSIGASLAGPVVFTGVPPGAYDVTITPVTADGNEQTHYAQQTSFTVDSGNLVNRPNNPTVSVS